MQEILTKYNFSFTDLFKLFPQEKNLLEEYTRLEKLVNRGHANFQKQFEAAGNKINDLLVKNEERLEKMAKAMERKKNGVPKQQPGEFFTIEVTQEDGSKNKQDKNDIDEATALFNTCAEAGLTVVMKKVSKNGEEEKSETIFQYTKGAMEPEQPQTQDAPQEINVKDDFAGIKFKNVKFQDAQAFIQFLILAGASRQWMVNAKYYFWLFPSQSKEYIITSKNPFEHSGSVGYVYIMIKNPATVETLKSLLFDICENHTEPIPVYESDTQDPLLQLTDDVKEPDAATPEPVSGIPYCEIDEAIEFLNKLDFDKFIHLLCIKKLYDENEGYRGENFEELIIHRLSKKLPVEYFNEKQLFPDKKIIQWLERKGFLNQNYEPAKVSENIIKLHNYCFGMVEHPFSCIMSDDKKDVLNEEIDINNFIRYWPCGYLPGVSYKNKTIIGHDNLLGYIVFCNFNNDNRIFISALEYDRIINDSKGEVCKFYSHTGEEYGQIIIISDKKTFALNTIHFQNMELLAINAKIKYRDSISYSDFKNENDILYNCDKTVKEEPVAQPAEQTP